MSGAVGSSAGVKREALCKSTETPEKESENAAIGIPAAGGRRDAAAAALPTSSGAVRRAAARGESPLVRRRETVEKKRTVPAMPSIVKEEE